MPSIQFTGNDKPALDYIIKRGYASYSSIKNVRDRVVPSSYSSPAQDIGKELHSRFLENRQINKLSKNNEIMVGDMLKSLRGNKAVMQLIHNARKEVKFHEPLLGLMVLGYIDSIGVYLSDLKTTRHTSKKSFVSSMDFLQAALYMCVTGKKDFYYIGISKSKPYDILLFNVNQYPDRIKAAHTELRTLIQYIKSKI